MRGKMRGGDGSGGPYPWSSMPGKPSQETPEAQRQAISSLLSDIGIAVGANYAFDERTGHYDTSAPMVVAAFRLKDTFKYSNAVHAADATIEDAENELIKIPASELEKMINPNLDARLPVLLGLTGDIGGHAIVADGYGYSAATLYHHLNMGWEGSSNAWYALPTIDAEHKFNIIDECTYNIYMSGTGEIVSGRVLAGIPAKPLDEVTVTFTGGTTPVTVKTNKAGIFAFKAVPSNTSYTITASKIGYTFTDSKGSTGSSKSVELASGEQGFVLPGTHICGNVWDVVITGTEDTSTEEPGTEEPGTEEPGTEEPGTEEPGTEDPGTNDPVIPGIPSIDDYTVTNGELVIADDERGVSFNIIQTGNDESRILPGTTFYIWFVPIPENDTLTSASSSSEVGPFKVESSVDGEDNAKLEIDFDNLEPAGKNTSTSVPDGKYTILYTDGKGHSGETKPVTVPEARQPAKHSGGCDVGAGFAVYVLAGFLLLKKAR
jgi:hypothetical protein